MSDFNGDGYADLAVGVPYEGVGDAFSAGAVNVLYGSAGGLQASSPNDQFWHQNSPDVEDTAEGGDGFGWSLASGDFNGDTYMDLVVGAPFEDVASIEDAGSVNVLHGSAGGLQTRSPNDQIWHQNSPGVEGGAEEGDQFGFSVAAGDFNDDGFLDLAIGAAFENVRDLELAGAVNILYGSAAGLQASNPNDRMWHQDSPSVKGTAEGFDNFGYSVGAGDFNSDGFADLAVGVSGEGVGAAESAGAVNVLHGSVSGLQASSPDDQLWTQDSIGVNGRVELGDFLGEFVASGDFNHDGFADLATSVTGESVGRIPDAGAFSALYGSATGLQTKSPPDQLWHQESPGVEGRAEAFDLFGFYPAIGDMNADGFADLAVGAPGEDVGAVLSAGVANVLYGSAAGLQTTSPSDQLWHQDSPEVEDMAEERDWFGNALTAVDFNADGFADLAVGVQQEDVGTVAPVMDAGTANVLYGSADGLQTTSPEDQLWHQDTSEVEDIAEEFDIFGFSLASGGNGFVSDFEVHGVR